MNVKSKQHKSHFSHTVFDTLSRVSARLSGAPWFEPSSSPTPEHVLVRLEAVFEGMSELSFQPDVRSAFDLACETLQAELPTAAVAAGLYDIDADQVRIVTARGLEHDLLRGAVLPRERCLVGGAAQHAVIARGGAGGADWIGEGDDGSTVLLCPILHDAHLLGLLALAEPLCAAEFSPHDLELVGYVAGRLAEFIQGVRRRASIAAPSPGPG